MATISTAAIKVKIAAVVVKINSFIKTNGNREITGAQANEVLNDMSTILGDIADSEANLTTNANILTGATVTWAALVAAAGSYVPNATYKTSDAPDGSTAINTITVKAISADRLAEEGDGLITTAVITDRPCRIRFNWDAAAGSMVTGYADGFDNILASGDLMTAGLDTWIGQLSLTNWHVHVMGAMLNASGGTLSDNTTIQAGANLALHTGTTFGGYMGVGSNANLVGTQSLTFCEIGDFMTFDGVAIDSAYAAVGKSLRKGFSNFTVNSSQCPAIQENGFNFCDWSGVGFAGILEMTDTGNPINTIFGMTTEFNVTIYCVSGTISLQDQTTGFGNIHLNTGTQSIPAGSRFSVRARNGGTDPEQADINIPYIS